VHTQARGNARSPVYYHVIVCVCGAGLFVVWLGAKSVLLAHSEAVPKAFTQASANGSSQWWLNQWFNSPHTQCEKQSLQWGFAYDTFQSIDQKL